MTSTPFTEELAGAVDDAFVQFHTALDVLVDALNAAQASADQLAAARTEPELELIIANDEAIDPAIRFAATRAYLATLVNGPRPLRGVDLMVSRMMLADLETGDANRRASTLDEVRDYTTRNRRDERRRWGDE